MVTMIKQIIRLILKLAIFIYESTSITISFQRLKHYIFSSSSKHVKIKKINHLPRIDYERLTT